MKTITWLFWRFFYFFRNRLPGQQDLAYYLIMGKRCWYPWKKFKPSVYRNDDGKMWQIWFSEEEAYTERCFVDVECHIGMESGKIVGFDIWDEMLVKFSPFYDKKMEQKCLKDHEEGKSRPLQEFIDEIKDGID